jgi:Activator of Hsp90 ATPase homolog 1-like protein
VTLDPGTGDATTIEATLSPEGSGTRLVVEERGIPLDEISAHGAGWQVHMEDLGTYLAGGDPDSWRPRWIELAPAYEDLSHALE